MGGGAWPFLVGGLICLVNSENERDLNLLNSMIKIEYKFLKFEKKNWILLKGTLHILVNGSLRQKQVCDALRCSGLHARYTDTIKKFKFNPPYLKRLGKLRNRIVIGIVLCNYRT